MTAPHALDFDWLHLQHPEVSAFGETYGFAGSQGMVNLEAIRIRPRGVASPTLLVYMHPASTLQLLPVPRAMAAAGAHVLCAASRYARNDTPLVFEKVLLDLGAWVRHARRMLGYERVVLVGWSGGGSLAMYYQAEAERPSVRATPAGDPIDIAGARLPPADAIVFQAAHVSRAELLLDLIDPSVRDEHDPDDRDVELDLYDPRNPHRPPYGADYLARFRAAQRARVDRITARVKQTLAELRRRGGGEAERGFVVHRTVADPRFLDATLDPNDRPPGRCWIGDPETANNGPVGLARFTTLRAWLSQWSIDDSLADAEACARRVAAPLLVVENGADDAVPPSHPRRVFSASIAADKAMHLVPGAGHYYAGQPRQLEDATRLVLGWLAERGLVDVDPPSAPGPGQAH